MRKSFSVGSVHYEILSPGERILSFPDIPSALSFLNRLTKDPAQTATLRNMIAGGRHDVHELSDEDVLSQFAALLVSGEVKLLRSPLHRGRRASPEAEEEKSPAASGGPTPGPKKHWVEFRVVDDKTGQPVAGVQLTVKIPGGGIEQHTTDAGGFIEIYDILRGECEVSSEISDSNSYAFVRIV